jgi:hypothetical protein
VAIGNQHMSQAHKPARAGGVGVEHPVTMSGQIRIDLIERFRTVNTSSFQKAVGICQR